MPAALQTANDVSINHLSPPVTIMKSNGFKDFYRQSIFILIIIATMFTIQNNPIFAADNKKLPLFSGGVSRSDAVLIAFPEYEAEDLISLENNDNLVLELWPQRPGHFIAAMLDAESNETMTLTISILKRVGKTVKKIASNEFQLEEFNWSNRIQLDLAPYRIRSDEFAFGVRNSTSYRSDAHSSSWTTLSLFRLADDSLSRILKTSVNESSISSGEENVENFSKATVHIGPLAENGFYSLLVKTIKGERSVESEKIIQQKKTSNTFHWKDTQYIERK
jgi:hypothetical protein